MSQVEARSAQYAVIQARWFGRPTECFPITYEDEEALRAIVASPSILACGIASREKALAVVRDRLSFVQCMNHLPATAICESAERKPNRRGRTNEKGAAAINWKRTRAALSDWARRAAGAVILVICSRNVLGGLLRAFIGV